METIRLVGRSEQGGMEAWKAELLADGEPLKKADGTTDHPDLLGLHKVLQDAEEGERKPGQSRSDVIYRVRSVRISTGANARADLSLAHASRFDLPGVLVSDDGGLRLRKPSEIERDLIALAAFAEKQATAKLKEEKAAAIAWLTDAYDALRAVLARRTLEFGAGGFFGVDGVFAAQGDVSLTLAIDAEALFAAIEGDGPTRRELLRAELVAAVGFRGQNGDTLSGRAGIAVTVTDADALRTAISLLPAFEFPELPDLPKLRFDLPPIDFSRLSLPGLGLDPLRNLFDLRLPLPRLDPGTFPLQIVWSPGGAAPSVSIGSGTKLGFALDASGFTGMLQINDSSRWLDLARIEGLKLQTGSGEPARYVVEGLVASVDSAKTKVGLGGLHDGGGRLPVTIETDDAEIEITLSGRYDLADPALADLRVVATAALPRLVIRARDDPRIVLALSAKWEATASAGGSATGRLTELRIIEPDPVELICAAAEGAIDGVVRLIGLVKLPGTPDLPGLPPRPDLSRAIARIGELLVASLKWAARQAGGAVGGAARLLAGLAEALVEAMGRVLDLAGRAASAALSHVAIEVRLDAETYALRQVLITPAKWNNAMHAEAREFKLAGLHLHLPGAWMPSLLLDFSGPLLAALIVTPQDAQDDRGKLVLGTDLWLDRDGAPTEAVRDTDEKGMRPNEPLIKLRAWKNGNASIALAALDGSRVSFFRTVSDVSASDPITIPGLANPQIQPSILRVRGRPVLQAARFGTDIDGDVTFKPDNAERLLPFLGTPMPDADAGDNLIGKLGQHVRLKAPTSQSLSRNPIVVPLEAEIVLDTLTTEVKLQLELDLSRMTARLTGGVGDLVIRGKQKHGDLFGLTYFIKPGPATELDTQKEFNQFRLDFSGGNPRMALHEDAEVELFYSRLGADGRGLVFKVEEFAVARGVFDIVAAVNPDEPVTLPGVDMPFRFRDGRLVVKRGEIQSFSITGTGQLPPELVGEASCTVRVMLGRGGDGRLAVLSCDAELDKTDDPIECHATCFTLTISKLGFAMEDFGDAGGYQFYFLVTGSIAFTPPGEAFAGTMLKNLRGARMTLTKAPLGRDMRLLMRAIDIQIALDPKVTVNLFDVFGFELRGFGFHPASEAFGGAPALSLSGQARFMETGDVISAKMDFHQMWIAPAAPGQALPRVRFDGLGVSLSLNGAGTIEGTAIAVDDSLPTLHPPDTLPPGVTARGFLASGRLHLEGWASMSASMGFLELDRGEQGRRHAFFLYGQLEQLSEPVPTPIKELYLREAGFGFGYRYTLAGLRRADTVTTPQGLVQVLDDVSRYQNDLADFAAWEPEASGSRITLALRGMLSVNSASTSGSLSEAEKTLPNPLLFDVAAALRSDLTFLMTARAWFSINYHTWVKGKNRDEIARNPMLRGYLYVSAPRRELLARLVSDPQGHVGETPPLPPALVKAFKAVKWSSTLYIRPGLFHFEFGWPHELELKLGDGNNFGLTCQGGLVYRIEDFSLLYGIAFRATGFARIGGQVGGRSLGASVEARADFSLDGRFIAYISLERARDTLFYGSLAFACTIEFRVKVWLEIKLGFKKLRLQASFSLRLSLSVALEVAVGPDLLAGRGAAAVGVRAFGRTLSISVGFGFNTGRLAEARARVERFLALGLASSVPDPAAGLAAPPPPAAAPAPGDGSFDPNAELHAELSEVAAGDPPTPAPGDTKITVTIGGEPIGAPWFWAMLFELPAKPGTYVMQLVPRDMTEAGITEVKPEDSTFFAPPDCSYRISGGDGLQRLVAEGDPEPVDGKSPIAVEVGQPVASEDGVNLTLGDLLRQAFLTEKIVIDTASGEVDERIGEELYQPRGERIGAGLRRASREAAEAGLGEAAAGMAKLSYKRAEIRAVEERRSSIIAAVCASAERIAKEARFDGAKIVWPGRELVTEEGTIDARDLGLTFTVKGTTSLDDTLDGLFTVPAAAPGRSCFTVAVLDVNGQPVATRRNRKPERSVRLYNPPSRFFDRRNPALAGLSWEAGPRGLALDWDLEPAWERSVGLWHDPEYHLKHYRIQRLFMAENGIFDAIPSFETTVKAAAPIRPRLENGQVVWEQVRPLAQFVDDFADLPESWREGLLQRGVETAAGYKQAKAGWDELPSQIRDDGKVRILYTVVPVDAAGHEGVGIPIEAEIAEPRPPLMALGRAELVVGFSRLPGIPRKSHEQDDAFETLLLRVDDLLDSEKEDTDQPQRLPLPGTFYLLKIRRERAAPIGLYGADALGAALQRPGPEEFARHDADDLEFTLTLLWPRNWFSGLPGKDDEERTGVYRRLAALEYAQIGASSESLPYFEIADASLDQLKQALGVNGKGNAEAPFAVRAALRRQKHASGWTPQDAVIDDSPSPWLPVDTLLWVGAGGVDSMGRQTPRPIETVVETFESPRVAGFSPLGFEDLDGEAGRLLIDYPAPSAKLDDLLPKRSKAGKPEKALARLRDGERRVATRIRWNATPTASGGDAGPAFIAGYDLFEIDMTGVSDLAGMVEAARAAARVQTLDPRLARIEPDGIDDYAAVEAYYPSETLRLQKAEGAGRRAAWYSPAESLCAWPKPALRRSLGLGANDADLAGLFELGSPDTVEVCWEGAQAGANAHESASWRRLEKLGLDPRNKSQLVPPKFGSVDTNRLWNYVADPAATVFKLRSDKHFKAADLRRLLHSLVLDEDDWHGWSSAEVFLDQDRVPAAFRDLTIVFTGRRGKGTTGTAELTVHLEQELHPFLADVVDALRWHEAADKSEFYRRYRPVIDPAPTSEAKTVAAFLDEWPAERDPYGWAVLRTLGLATGLRLYDMTQGDYLEPEKAIGLVDAAVAMARERYPKTMLQAPMVEVMCRADGLYRLASFDGGTPPVTNKDARDLVDNEALALVQVSLRPIAENLTEDKPHGVSRYFTVEKAKKTCTSLVVDMERMQFTAGSQPILIDAIDLSSGLSAGRITTLAQPGDTIARKRLAGGRDVRSRIEIDVTGNDGPVLLLRVIAPGVSDIRDKLLKVLGPAKELGLAKDNYAITEICAPKAMNGVGKTEAFERFPELDAAAIATIVTGSAKGSMPDPEAKGRFIDLRWHAARRFPGGVPRLDTDDERDAFFARWPGLVRRFLSHGPADRRAVSDPGHVAFALVTIPRPQPFRVEVQTDGTMEVVLVHKDRLARRRRYLVRPFGRYENLMSAWHAAQPDPAGSRSIPWVARRSLADSVKPAGPGKAEDPVSLPWIEADKITDHAVDIVVPRTEPLAPPVILSAARLDVGERTERRPGRLVELVVARHQEEIASEANSSVADSLQFEHMAFGFWREFAHPKWAAGLSRIPQGKFEIDLVPETSQGTPGAPALSFPCTDSFDEVPEDGRMRGGLPARIADGWRGVTAVRTQGVPHFYRMHAAVFAAAGVVVSNPVAATIPEGRFELHWPWPENVPKPSWSVDRNDEKRTVRIVFSLPLVRYLDGMPAEDRKHWLPKTNKGPRVFMLPDPGVVYELSTRLAPAGSDGLAALLAADISQEAEFLALPGSVSRARYAVKSAGARLTFTGDVLSPELGRGREFWRLVPKMQVRLPPSEGGGADSETPAAADRAPFDGVPQVACALPEDLRGAAKEVADKLRTPTFEFVVPVDLAISHGAIPTPAGETEAEPDGPYARFMGLIGYLETHQLYPGAPGLGLFPALEALEAVKKEGGGTAQLRVPWAVKRDGSLKRWLKALERAIERAGGTMTFDMGDRPVAVILRRPPDEAEMQALKGIVGDRGVDARARLETLVTELAADQIFGTGRRPFVRATKGLLDPLDAAVSRQKKLEP